MPFQIPIRFEEDLTASNPANFIAGDAYTLPENWKNRVFVPRYGAFFTKDMVVRDASGRVLERGKNKHYVCVESPLRYPTTGNITLNEMSGFETAQFIVVVDPNVSQNLTVDLRYVGGAYSINQDALIKALETLALDTRPVLWEDVGDKPPGYLPAWHITDARDIMNMGAVCFWLEKIYEALILGDQRQWDAIYKYIERRYPSKVDLDELNEQLFNPGYDMFMANNY